MYTLIQANIPYLYSEIRFVDDLIYKGGDSALKQIDGMEEYIFVSVVGIVEVLRTERGVEREDI